MLGRRGVIRFLVFPLSTIALLTLTAPLEAAVIRLEAEQFTAYHDAGGTKVGVRTCSAASEHRTVDGLDRDGEWIELSLHLGRGMRVTESLRSAGYTGLVRQFDIAIIDEAGEEVEERVTTIPGLGFT